MVLIKKNYRIVRAELLLHLSNFHYREKSGPVLGLKFPGWKVAPLRPCPMVYWSFSCLLLIRVCAFALNYMHLSLVYKSQPLLFCVVLSRQPWSCVSCSCLCWEPLYDCCRLMSCAPCVLFCHAMCFLFLSWNSAPTCPLPLPGFFPSPVPNHHPVCYPD